MKRKNSGKKLIFCLICLVSFFARESTAVARMIGKQSGVKKGNSPLEVSMDPRVELISILQYISAFRVSGYRLMTDFDFEYRRRIDHYFALYKNHPAVKMIEAISPKGFVGDVPPWFIIHLSDPPELKIRHPLTSRIKERIGGDKQVDQLLVLLRDFVRDTHFIDFLYKNQDQHEKIIKAYKKKMGNHDYVKIMEDYTGMKQNWEYHAILVPLYGPLGFGLHIEGHEGKSDVFNICGPQFVENGIPEFGTEGGLRHLLLHEFGHSVNNPLIDGYESELNNYDKLYEPIKQKAEREGYGNKWITIAREMINCAFTIRLVDREFGQKEAGKDLSNERKKGWAYLPAICERLKEYEANRDKYKTYADFFLRIADLFRELSEKELDDEFFFIPFDGTISSVRGNVKGIVIIVPTHESDPDVLIKIQEYARKMRDERHAGMPILTDDEALKQDLSQKSLVVFGTKDGNLFLKRRLADHPVQIAADAITADIAYAGTNLRFIAAWPNPQNAKKGMVVYTAQRAEDIIGIREAYAWDEEYVVARGSEVLKTGFYKKEKEKWSF